MVDLNVKCRLLFFGEKEIALNEIRVYNIRGYETPQISASNWLTTKAGGKI
jgi:hypothetical protein